MNAPEYADQLARDWNRDADEAERTEETGLTYEQRRDNAQEAIGDRQRDED